MMMPPDNITKKDQEIINQGSKIKTTRPTPTPPPEQGVLKCPRCDSPNTKFCYYNNYSLTQPRHFCKTCRRYWTNGGALRNVPIGGGCRKNHNKKKVKKTSSSYSSSSISSRLSCDSSSKDSASSSSELSAGLRFFHINNSSSPSLEFHLGGLPLIPPRLHQQQQQQQPSFTNQFSSFGATSAASSFQLDPSGGDPDSLIGLNHPFSSSTGSGLVNNGAAIIQGMNNSSMNVNSTSNSALASSIESLSSMNQDLHWKLQQQRLAMMFTGGDNNNNQKDKDSCGTVSLPQVNKPQPILFQNLEISKPEMFQAGSRKGQGPSGDAPIEWFFGTDSTTTTTTTITSSVVNGHDENAANNNWGSGVHAWGDVQQPYSVLP